MLHGQEMRWREKLQASTAHLSEALGKDLKLGVDEVKELAGQAVNNSDRLAYEISSDRRQLESAETEEALEKAATFEVHDEDAAKEFIPKAHALLSRHAATAGWFAAYEAATSPSSGPWR